MMTRFLAFAAFVLAAGMVLGQAPDYAAEGGKALDAKNYPAAVELFTKAVAADPKDYTAHFNLALSYSLLDRCAEAVPEYKLTLELHPGLYDAQLNLGICLVRMKDAASAIEPLKAAVGQKPKEFRPVYTLAQAQLALSDWASAEASFTQAIALNPASAAAEEGWGEALSRQSKLGDAETHIRKAAAIDAGYKPALLQLGELYERANLPAQAIAIYREFPDNVAAQERMGVLLKESGDTAAAIPALESAVAKSPTPANRVALAQAYVAAKDPTKAIPLVAVVIAATPDDYDLRLFYGSLLRDQRRFTEAAPQFIAAAKLKPDAVQPWNELSSVLIIAEQYEQALQALDRVFALHGETPAHYYFRAISYDHLHVLKQALANYKKFLELSQGQHPDEEFKSRQRARIIQNELDKR